MLVEKELIDYKNINLKKLNADCFYQFFKAYYNDILQLYIFVEGVWTKCSNDLTFNLV